MGTFYSREFSLIYHFYLFLCSTYFLHRNTLFRVEGVGVKGAGGAIGLQVYGRSVNPIPTRRADYAHQITTGSITNFDPTKKKFHTQTETNVQSGVSLIREIKKGSVSLQKYFAFHNLILF